MIAGPYAEHDRIRALADRFDAHLAAATAPLDAGFPKLRWELIRELATHFALERDLVRLRAAACDTRTALRLDVELESVWRGHVAYWSGARVQAEWRTYRIATRVLLSRIRMRMVWEERLDTDRVSPAH